MSFQEIAYHVIAVAQGKIRPLVGLPEVLDSSLSGIV
jgi:hypothetical protein